MHSDCAGDRLNDFIVAHISLSIPYIHHTANKIKLLRRVAISMKLF